MIRESCNERSSSPRCDPPWGTCTIVNHLDSYGGQFVSGGVVQRTRNDAGRPLRMGHVEGSGLLSPGEKRLHLNSRIGPLGTDDEGKRR